MKAACGFGYGPDASVLDVEVIKSNLGVETFSSDMRAIICEQSFCRGQIARMADLFKKCPGEAGTKGERARLVRMLMGTVKSCTRAGGATVNVQDTFLLKGVDVLNPGEHDGLAAAVEEALANGLPHGWPWWLSLDWPVYLLAWLAGVPFAHTHGTAKSLVSVNVRPHYPKVDVWSRAAGVADVTMPAGQGAVAFVPQDLPGGACQGCTVRNLQVLAVHPAIGAEEVDPEGLWHCVDMIVAWGSCQEHSKFVVEAVRRGAPNTLIGTGINPGAYESQENALKLANEMRAAGTDIIYCSGLVPEKFAGLARPLGKSWQTHNCEGSCVVCWKGAEDYAFYFAGAWQHFPCCGHVGYLPVNNTWYGGPRGVGKTAVEAKKVYDDVMALEAAGCIAVEMECVPAKAHLMSDAVDALKQFCRDVASGAYPEAKHCIKINDDEFAAFLRSIN
eukprot:symbB.v1.2.002798.t1/scaffold91.1/size338584/3